ncbi:MAG: Omp85 family outer membrane protein [Luteibaculaceae bacterium]
MKKFYSIKTWLFALAITFFGNQGVYAQTDTLTAVPAVGGATLPFDLDPRKKMPEEEIEAKREGTFVTGLPRFEFDPIRGFGVGGNAFFYFNKDKSDPFYAYTPYRHRVNAEFFIFENGRVRYALQYDAPYIFNSKWRLRADAIFWEDPEAQYWGIGRRSLNSLQFVDKRRGGLRSWNSVNDYEENLALLDENGRTDANFNSFIQREHLYNALLERTFWGGKGRIMFGYELLLTGFESWAGRTVDNAIDPATGREVEAVHNATLIDLEIAEGRWDEFNLTGFSTPSTGYNVTNMLAFAFIYDTRDFEPDPSEGIFLEYSHEYAPGWMNPKFDFNKMMIQGQYIKTLHRWNGNKNRITFAALGALGHIWGPAKNFIEMWDLSSQAEAGGILVLGGERSVRGFREARFVAPTVALMNFELRSRFVNFRALKQDFTFGVTAFYDTGSVWDDITDINFSRWVGAPGLGGRLAWNQSTVLRLDYAQSREGGQFFFGFGQIF